MIVSSGNGDGGVGGNSKIVATLGIDGKVYPRQGATLNQLASLVAYKINTNEPKPKTPSSGVNVPTTVVDLGKQLLQFARDNDTEGVKCMLVQGAPFSSDWLGMTSLHFAAMNNQLEICRLLLKAGIMKDARTKVDRTALHFACFHGHERIVKLLLHANSNVNAKDMLRMTPLHWAVEKRHKSIVTLLLKYNADVTVVSKFGKTPIALAVLTEQADVLQELEAARQVQASKKFYQESKKETTDAINSIVNVHDDIIEEQIISDMDFKQDEDMPTPNTSDIVDSKIAYLVNINKESKVLDNLTINLLKSHGISMMQDDEDTSKKVLNNALQNGRQLVLTEGGKMLLKETKNFQRDDANIINNNNNNNNNNNVNNNKSQHNKMHISSGDIKRESNNVSSVAQVNKVRPNIMMKAKDNLAGSKNKNIRIISLNDFKKMYTNTNLKAMPSSLANSRFVKQLAESKKFGPNSPRPQQQLQQLTQVEQNKVSKMETQDENSLIEEDDIEEPTANIMKIPVTPETQSTSKIPISAPPIRVIPSARLEPKPSSSVPVQKVNTLRQLPNVKTANIDGKSSAIIPLFTVPEICRQLCDLRKQHDDLKQRYEASQKDNEELRLRVERLEEMFFVERTDEEIMEAKQPATSKLKSDFYF